MYYYYYYYYLIITHYGLQPQEFPLTITFINVTCHCKHLSFFFSVYLRSPMLLNGNVLCYVPAVVLFISHHLSWKCWCHVVSPRASERHDMSCRADMSAKCRRHATVTCCHKWHHGMMKNVITLNNTVGVPMMWHQKYHMSLLTNVAATCWCRRSVVTFGDMSPTFPAKPTMHEQKC